MILVTATTAVADAPQEYHYLKDYFETLGFPHIDNSSYPECGVIGLNGQCSKQRMFPSYPFRAG